MLSEQGYCLAMILAFLLPFLGILLLILTFTTQIQHQDEEMLCKCFIRYCKPFVVKMNTG